MALALAMALAWLNKKKEYVETEYEHLEKWKTTHTILQNNKLSLNKILHNKKSFVPKQTFKLM